MTHQKLSADAPLNAKVGGAIYDAVPSGVLPPLYVTLGPEEVKDASDGSNAGAEHEFTISVISEVSGFQSSKESAVTSKSARKVSRD